VHQREKLILPNGKCTGSSTIQNKSVKNSDVNEGVCLAAKAKDNALKDNDIVIIAKHLEKDEYTTTRTRTNLLTIKPVLWQQYYRQSKFTCLPSKSLFIMRKSSCKVLTETAMLINVLGKLLDPQGAKLLTSTLLPVLVPKDARLSLVW